MVKGLQRTQDVGFSLGSPPSKMSSWASHVSSPTSGCLLADECQCYKFGRAMSGHVKDSGSFVWAPLVLSVLLNLTFKFYRIKKGIRWDSFSRAGQEPFHISSLAFLPQLLETACLQSVCLFFNLHTPCTPSLAPSPCWKHLCKNPSGR